MAKSSQNVNTTYTRTFTGGNTGIVIGKHRNMDSRLIGGVRTGNIIYGAVVKSVSITRSIGEVAGRTCRTFRAVSILIGGTKVAGSGLLVKVGSRSFSTIIGIGLHKAFLVAHTFLGGVCGGGDKTVVGLTSIMKLRKGVNRTGCTTTGTNMINLAGAYTGRKTLHGVEYGTVTPKVVRDSVADMLDSGIGRRALQSVPLRHFNGIRRITRATIFLTRGSCVANRIVPISNKVAV